MVTPDRIPEFIIPSLDLLDERKHLGKVKALEQMSRNKIKDCHRFPQGSFLTCCSRVELDLGVNDIPADSVTQAALSLPHLPKIITPYGFVSLGQSPHVTKEEALFFQFGLASSSDPNTKRDLDSQGGDRLHSDGDSVQAACTNSSLRDHCPYRAQVVSQAHLSESSSSSIKNRYRLKLSDPGEVQDTDVFSKSSAFLATTCSDLDCPSLSLQKRPKNRFQNILKKHCACLRNLKGMKMPSWYPTTDATCYSKESKTWDMSKK
ncbi:C2 calcium-dependent domain-containing protein 4A-like [Crotalus adamanteus]|uniref:C2 calcium-dependent domain-containing protein 4A-like n=1 Tax=Crotalus adamanteus TaxID=8729 RepID=A0AAW1C6C8_CROAD